MTRRRVPRSHLDRLPDWRPGTVAVLCTVDGSGVPHAIPVSTALRVGDRRMALCLPRPWRTNRDSEKPPASIRASAAGPGEVDKETVMTRASKAMILVVVLALGLWGCARGPVNRAGGIFTASAAVRAEVTAPSVREFRTEIERMADVGVTVAELQYARDVDRLRGLS